MSCINPLIIKNKRYASGKTHSVYHANILNWKEYLQVPCGWCLNCRIDKRNALEDRCNYELLKTGLGAFVTLTYDDEHISNLLKNDINDKPILSLCRDDYRNFIKRLRSYISYHKLYNNPSIKTDFKYLLVGEYGGQYKRPHFHVLFFGLDYKKADKLIQICWQNGITQSKPIKRGGIRYVLKYLDKQVHGEDAKVLYDYNNIERPFMVHSLGLGTDLYLQNIDYIKQHNYCYKTKHNLLRPVPIYYRNKIFGHYIKDDTFITQKMKDNNIKPDYYGIYSIQAKNAYKHQLALLKNKNIIETLRMNGESAFEDLTNYKMYDINNDIEIAYYGDIVPF